MNKRQVTILWVIAIALGVAVTAVKLSQNQSTLSATQRKAGETLFEAFPATEAAAVTIEGLSDSVTLVKKDGKWLVAERDNYPANNTFVNDLLRTLGELKITQALEAGPSFAPRFGMDDSATKPEEHGLTATFKDAADKEIAVVSLGKNIESGASQSPMMGGGGSVGRYVRNHADESGFYAVSEMFPSVSAEAKRWLADGFVSPEKIKSIAVSLPGKADPAWKLTRETEEAEFKLDSAAPTEVADTTVTSPLKNLFSYARFDDVVPSADVAGRVVAEEKRVATIETFEGFTYTVGISPTKPSTAPPAPVAPGQEPSATDNFLVTVDVAAELPKERKKEEGEKPEDAKTKDTAFTDRLKALTEKLAKEKALAGVTFEVAKTTIEPLLKDRAGLLTKAEPATDAASTPPVQQLPGGMIARPPVTATTPPIEAVTPPISVPASDDDGDYADDDETVEEEMEEE